MREKGGKLASECPIGSACAFGTAPALCFVVRFVPVRASVFCAVLCVGHRWEFAPVLFSSAAFYSPFCLCFRVFSLGTGWHLGTGWQQVLCIPNNPPPTLGKDGHYNKHFHTFLEQCFQRDPNLR